MMNFTSMYSGMGGAMNSINVHHYLKQRYGCGYSDFGSKPYMQGYPMAITPMKPKNPVQRNPIIKFILNVLG